MKTGIAELKPFALEAECATHALLDHVCIWVVVEERLSLFFFFFPNMHLHLGKRETMASYTNQNLMITLKFSPLSTILMYS